MSYQDFFKVDSTIWFYSVKVTIISHIVALKIKKVIHDTAL